MLGVSHVKQRRHHSQCEERAEEETPVASSRDALMQRVQSHSERVSRALEESRTATMEKLQAHSERMMKDMREAHQRIQDKMVLDMGEVRQTIRERLESSTRKLEERLSRAMQRLHGVSEKKGEKATEKEEEEEGSDREKG